MQATLTPSPLSPQRISELQAMGYIVVVVSDFDPTYYGWMHKGCDATYVRARRTTEQAWYDCDRYVTGSAPAQPDPDWKS